MGNTQFPRLMERRESVCTDSRQVPTGKMKCDYLDMGGMGTANCTQEMNSEYYSYQCVKTVDANSDARNNYIDSCIINTCYSEYGNKDCKPGFKKFSASQPAVRTPSTVAPATNSQAKPTNQPNSQPMQVNLPSNMASLIQKNNCLSCHKQSAKAIGPAFEEVRRKYQYTSRTIQYVAYKIINGGSGAWGQVPMPANSSISQQDAIYFAHWVFQSR